MYVFMGDFSTNFRHGYPLVIIIGPGGFLLVVPHPPTYLLSCPSFSFMGGVEKKVK